MRGEPERVDGDRDDGHQAEGEGSDNDDEGRHRRWAASTPRIQADQPSSTPTASTPAIAVAIAGRPPAGRNVLPPSSTSGWVGIAVSYPGGIHAPGSATTDAKIRIPSVRPIRRPSPPAPDSSKRERLPDRDPRAAPREAAPRARS